MNKMTKQVACTRTFDDKRNKSMIQTTTYRFPFRFCLMMQIISTRNKITTGASTAGTMYHSPVKSPLNAFRYLWSTIPNNFSTRNQKVLLDCVSCNQIHPASTMSNYARLLTTYTDNLILKTVKSPS